MRIISYGKNLYILQVKKLLIGSLIISNLFSYTLTDYLFYALKNIKGLPKIGIALSGGGARGIAHIGVLKVLEEEEIPVNFISGTSAGALIGGFYASGFNSKRLLELAKELKWSNIVRPKVSPSNLLNLKYVFSQDVLEDYVREKIGNKKFYELKIPACFVSCDLRTGEKIVFREGDVSIAMRASSAIPGIFEPVYYKHRILVDGGVVDKVPVDVLIEMGAEFIIASNVGKEVYSEEFGNLIDILSQIINIQANEISSIMLRKADVVIEPDTSGIKFYELNKWEMAVEKGIVETRRKMKEIKEKLILKMIER